MVYVDEENLPRMKHFSGKEAMREAERLAKLTGKDVFLLEATDFARYIPPTPPPELEWHETV